MIRASGYAALLSFMMSFYLASRIPLLNRIFDGLQRQLRWHHWIAVVSVAAMLGHLGQLLWSYREHVELLFDWHDFALSSGWITLTGIIIITPFAFYRVQIPYRRWRVIHLVTSLCLVSALLHTFLLLQPDELSEWVIFFLLAAFGIIALLLSVILPEFSSWGRKYQIVALSEPSLNLFLLKLQPDQHEGWSQFQYKAGQFLYLRFLSPHFSRIWHPFTVISKPSDSFIELFIKARGMDTDQLKSIILPTPVRILAPFGTSFWQQDQSQLWIAYGVGAAIFIAAIRSFPTSFHNRIHFICCDSSKNKMFFSAELDDCMQKNLNFTWEAYIGSGQQFISEFNNRVLDYTSFEKFRICGHPGFQNSLKSMLISFGIRKSTIHLEGLL